MVASDDKEWENPATGRLPIIDLFYIFKTVGGQPWRRASKRHMDRHSNSWPTADFLEAIEHPVFNDALSALLIVIDRGGEIVYTNRAFRKCCGFSDAELRGKHFSILFPERQRQAVSNSFDQMGADGPASDFVIPLCSSSGESLYIHWSTATLTTTDGAFEYLVGSGIDTTEHRRTLLSFEKSHRRFQDLVETIGDWVWETDAGHRFTYCSPQIEAILGYRPEEIIGKTPFDLMPADEVARLTREFGRKPAATGVDRMVSIKCHKDGRSIIMESSGVPFFSDRGELLGYRGVSRDITERQNILQALQRSEERLRLSQRFANIGSWEWDIATGSVYWSEQVWPLFGLPVNSFEPSYARFLDHVHADDRGTVVCALKESLARGNPFDVEFRIAWPDGSIHWLRGTGNVDRDAGGEPVRMLGVVSNIDQHKSLEREIARQADRQRNLLVREVHHRIKNNLQGIVGLLRNNMLDMSGTARVMLKKTITQINSIALIHGIHGQRDGRELLLCELLPAIVEGHATVDRELAQIDFSQHVDNPLQLLDREAVPIALILNELITNAVKHADRRDGRDRVNVSLHIQDGVGEIRIYCPGGRLPEGFDFHSGSGHGTGLSLIRALLPAEGISVRYQQTEAGVSTVVRLTAPLVRAYHSSGQERRPSAPAPAEKTPC